MTTNRQPSPSRRVLAVILFTVCFGGVRAQELDSSRVLFDDAVLHTFRITFSVPGWQDSLTANYLAGEVYMPARVEYDGLAFDSVGVRYKGNSSYVQSRHTPKKPLKLKFDEYRSKQTFFGVKTLNFSNAVKDPTFLREKLAYDILGRLMPSPRAAYAWIEVNGEPLGLYLMVEQIDKTFLKRHFADNGFNLYKAGDNGATLEYRGRDKEAYKREFELKTNEKEDDWTRFIDMVEVLNDAPRDSFVSRAGATLDLDRCIRLLAFNMAVSNFDSYTGSGRNYYLYDDRVAGKFVILPWDPNEAFGAYSNEWDVIRQDVLTPSNLSRRPLLRRIVENDSLRTAYLAVIRNLVDGPASGDTIAAAVARWKPFLDPLVRSDPHKLYPYDLFLENFERDVYVGINMRIPALIPFVRLRGDNVRSQVDAYSAAGADYSAVQPFVSVDGYPNPSRGGASVRFVLRRGGRVGLSVYDLLGREVRRLDAGDRLAGAHEIPNAFDGLPSGVYHCRLAFTDALGSYRSGTYRLALTR
ncbi:MAG: CotH kinase family protein [Bacteroidota bacterium]|nr:CotH kinase family protein [Bacteroidota bacterium]